jgi:hypothetical protein
MKRLVFFIIILAVSSAVIAWERPFYEDSTIVERSELILVAHIKEGSIEYVQNKDNQGNATTREYHVTLVIKEVLKGQCNEKEIPIIIHYGLTPVVGGYEERDNFMINPRGGRTNYPKDIIEIFDTGNSTHGTPSLVKDAREDNIWFLRKRSGPYGREPGTGKLGIVDPEDLQPLEWKDYFLQYLEKDPEKAVKDWGLKNPDRSGRAQRYFDHLEIQRILEIKDPNERFEKLLPYYLKRTTWNMQSEAKSGIISCGKIAGDYFMKVFDDPAYKNFRDEIILMWRDIKYRQCIPLLIDLLKKHDQFWAEQKLEKGWWNSDVDSDLTNQRRNIYGEVYHGIYTLRSFNDPQTREVIELTSNRWKAINFDNTQIVEECGAALKQLSESGPN